MDIAKRVINVLTNTRNAFVPLSELQPPLRCRLPKQQMYRLYRQKVSLNRTRLQPRHLERAREVGKVRAKARKAREASLVSFDKCRLM